MTWSYCLHRRYSMSPQKNSTLVNEHVLNREPVPLTWDQALLLLLLFFVSLAREGKNNACYIHLTSRQPLPRLHNLMFAWPAMLLANQHLPDGNQILARSLFWNKKYRLKSTTYGWRHFGQLEQHKIICIVSYPIRKKSRFWLFCMWSVILIACYSKFNSSTSHVNNCFASCFIGFLIMLQCTNVCLIWIYFAYK